MSILRAPYIKLTWSASSLTTTFAEYRIYRRPLRSPQAQWTMIAQLAPPSGYTATTFEANGLVFHDYEMGWTTSGGAWSAGWDYAATAVSTTGIEHALGSAVSAGGAALTAAADEDSWIVSNTAPFLNTPIENVNVLNTKEEGRNVSSSQVAGRDYLTIRQRTERSGKVLTWGGKIPQGAAGEQRLAQLRAMVNGSVPVALHTPQGDRYMGVLGPLQVDRSPGPVMIVRGTLYETTRSAHLVTTSSYPAGMASTGGAGYLTGSTSICNPASGAFSVAVLVSGFVWSSNVCLATKGNIGTADGWGIRCTATTDQFAFIADGASATGTAQGVSAITTSSHDLVCFLGTHTSGSQVLYLQGAQLGTASAATGSITNAVAVTLGANNGGATNRVPTGTRLHALYYWPRALSAADARDASYMLLGYAGKFPFASADTSTAYAWDMRSSRAWNGGLGTDVHDANANGQVLTATGTAGIGANPPWNYAQLEDW